MIQFVLRIQVQVILQAICFLHMDHNFNLADIHFHYYSPFTNWAIRPMVYILALSRHTINCYPLIFHFLHLRWLRLDFQQEGHTLLLLVTATLDKVSIPLLNQDLRCQELQAQLLVQLATW